MCAANNRVAPILRWAGSKRKLLPKLIPYWGAGYKRYIEPFAGSASLYFALQPPVAILSDTNAELIETLELVRTRTRYIYTRLSNLKVNKKSYYRLRSQNPERLSPSSRAARFIFLNRFCFNGLYRTNTKGRFNVPYAPEGTGNVPTWENFHSAAVILDSATILCEDFERAVTRFVRPGDFVYLDPPFAVGNRRIFRQYGANTFGLQDLERLARVLTVIDKRGAVFVLSYAYCSEAKKTFFRWPQKRVLTNRNISGFAKHRRRAMELIISNIPPLCPRLSARAFPVL
jgi:DNA adenine methylase